MTYVDEPGGGKRSASDYVYGYGPALEDSVVRPVIFLAYSGEMRWRTRAGDEITATLGTPMTKDQIAQAWRTALDPAGEWVSRVLEAADKRLTEVRRGMPDAGGLVIAGDHEDARAYAALLRGLTGKRPGRGAVRRQDREQEDLRVRRPPATAGWSRCGWCPRAWTSRAWPSASTRPACPPRCSSPRRSAGSSGPGGGGRPRRCSSRRFPCCCPTPPNSRPNGTTSSAPRTPRRPRTRSRSPRPSASAIPPTRLYEPAFQALNASAHFDRVLYDGGEFGTATAAGSPEEEDFLGLPGLLDPDQVRALLRKRQDAQLAARSAPPPQQLRIRPAAPSTPHAPSAPPAPSAPQYPVTPVLHIPSASHTTSAPQAPPAAPPVSRQALAALRKELNGLVGAWSHRTGQPHGVIHAELRRTCGGPPLPQATADQIRARIDTIRRWALSGR